MKKIITPTTVSLTSDPVEITSQTTFVALGLESTDTVTFWLVLLTDPVRPSCDCPPAGVTLPSILAETQLQCCGANVQITATNPVVILDYPQGFKVRLKLNVTGAATTQTVMMQDATTTNVTERMRGCACP